MYFQICSINPVYHSDKYLFLLLQSRSEKPVFRGYAVARLAKEVEKLTTERRHYE